MQEEKKQGQLTEWCEKRRKEVFYPEKTLKIERRRKREEQKTSRTAGVTRTLAGDNDDSRGKKTTISTNLGTQDQSSREQRAESRGKEGERATSCGQNKNDRRKKDKYSCIYSYICSGS